MPSHSPVRFIFSVSVLLTVGCGNNSESATPDPRTQGVTIISDEASLTQRLALKSEILSLQEVAAATASPLTATMAAPSSAQKDFTLTLVGEVSPPTVDGISVQATDVAISGNYVFVSYNVRGDLQRGAIDVFDIANINKPALVSSVLFSARDINALSYHDNSLFFTGATSVPDARAFWAVMPLSSSRFASDAKYFDLNSFAGTDLVWQDKVIYVSSGNKGGITAFDAQDFHELWQKAIGDARSLAVIGSKERRGTWMLTGSDAHLLQLSDSGEQVSDIVLGGSKTAEAKSVVLASRDYLLASLSESGWKLICKRSEEVVFAEPGVQVAGLSPDKSTTNAVGSSPGLIYAANGEAGVYVYAAKVNGSSCKPDIALLGSISFGKEVSVNHLAASKDIIVAAAGNGGLKILTNSKQVEADDLEEFDDDGCNREHSD